jgi:hypothetical protein
MFRAGEGLPSSLHLLSCHADPHTPEDSSLSLQVPNSFRGLRPYVQDSASSFPSCEAFLTTRQDSLYVTAWHIARPVSDRYFRRCASTHRFRRTQASQLRGGLAPPATGLSPARRCALLGTPYSKKRGRLPSRQSVAPLLIICLLIQPTADYGSTGSDRGD